MAGFADTGRNYFGLIGPGNVNPRHWVFKTADATTVVDGAGYFNEVGDLLHVGDMITVQIGANIGTTSETVTDQGTYVVNSVSRTAGVWAVDVTNETAITVTDSD